MTQTAQAPPKHPAAPEQAHPAIAPADATKAKPPPPATHAKPASGATQDCPLKAVKPCDVNKLEIEVEIEGQEADLPGKTEHEREKAKTRKLETTHVRRRDAVTDVKNKRVLDLLSRYDLVIDAIASYPSREDPYPEAMVKISAHVEWAMRVCPVDAHPRLELKPLTAMDLPWAQRKAKMFLEGVTLDPEDKSVVVKGSDIKPPLKFHALPLGADLAVAGGRINILIEIIRSLWPMWHPAEVEIRADACGKRARGDGAKPNTNLVGLVRIFRRDKIFFGVKLPPLGKFKHEREGTLTGEHEYRRATETQFGTSKTETRYSEQDRHGASIERSSTEVRRGGVEASTSEYTRRRGSEYTHDTNAEVKGEGFSASSSTHYREDARTVRWKREGEVTIGQEEEHHGKLHMFHSAMDALKKSNMAITLRRNDRQIDALEVLLPPDGEEKENARLHGSLKAGRDWAQKFAKDNIGKKFIKDLVVDGIAKGAQLIAQTLDMLKKAPQLGWKIELELAVFEGSIGLEWGPGYRPGPLAEERYWPVGIDISFIAEMLVFGVEFKASFGVDAKCLGTGLVLKVELAITFKVPLKTDLIKIGAHEESKEKVIALTPIADLQGRFIFELSVLYHRISDARFALKIAFNMNDGKFIISREHGVKLEGTIKFEKIVVIGYYKLPGSAVEHVMDPIELTHQEYIVHKFG